MSETLSFLPTERSEVLRRDPRVFILYGPPKVGKTTLISTLPNNLILDLEGGTEYVDALSINIIGWSPPAKEKLEVANARREEGLFYIAEAGQDILANGKPYDFLTIDTITELEEMVMPLAASMYKATPMGANWPGSDVRELPRGAGYLYLRKAFKDAINKLKKLADNIILIGHLKDTFIEKEGKEVVAKDLALTGKIKEITCAGADAIGYLHWGKEGALLINFRSADEVLCGSRCKHLKGKEIQIGTYNKVTDMVEDVDWSLVYPDTIK